MHKWWHTQRGSQIVEFALIGPILVFLVLSVPILGLSVRSWLVVEAAAREGARVVAIKGAAGESEARERVWNEVTVLGGLKTRDAGGSSLFTREDIFVDTSNGVVVVQYRQPTYVPFLGRLLNAGEQGLGNYFLLMGKASYLPEHQRGI